ncbi:sensor domain-containing phosphodiesterase [Roseobacter sp. MH60115]|uniref:sensor domain-containing phosphodiesterase n=1 Tax=Roseobacter sp. MH60115 TaxID=2785324 RepID=UPI001E3BD715|nr:EAL domain-containing protein [Roseobacter sp. MH60115]
MTDEIPGNPLPIAARVNPMGGDDTIQMALDFVRTHLNMEVAYLSEFVGDDLVFRAVSAPGFEEMCFVGGSMPLDQVYCRHILAGRLPELIPDTADEPLCADIALTNAIPIKAHVSVPIRRPDGTPYGMFCCLSRTAQRDLNPRDLEVMRAFADLSAEQVNTKITTRVERQAIRSRIEQIQADEAFDIVYQPIVDLNGKRPKGFEALCRFRSEPYRPPNLWFDDALVVGMQADLEIAVIRKALLALEQLPQDTYLSVNASPATVGTGLLADLFANYPQERIVLEVTEHSMVEDYEELLGHLEILRFRGVRLAIDDAGAGYSGLQHIVKLKPDLIKLDISLTSSIDTDVVRRSLGAALVRFAVEIGADIVAEGIETDAELNALSNLGVPLAQGYYLGKPGDLDSALAWFKDGKKRA